MPADPRRIVDTVRTLRVRVEGRSTIYETDSGLEEGASSWHSPDDQSGIVEIQGWVGPRGLLTDTSLYSRSQAVGASPASAQRHLDAWSAKLIAVKSPKHFLPVKRT